MPTCPCEQQGGDLMHLKLVPENKNETDYLQINDEVYSPRRQHKYKNTIYK